MEKQYLKINLVKSQDEKLNLINSQNVVLYHRQTGSKGWKHRDLLEKRRNGAALGSVIFQGYLYKKANCRQLDI